MNTGTISCPWCNKEFTYLENAGMASRAFRRHVVTCPQATPEQRQRAAAALSHAADGAVTQTLAQPR